MQLGPLKLANRYVLAPMQNVTTAPYRRFCRTFCDIGLVSVPMMYTKNIVKTPKSIEPYLYKIEEERPISIQIIGSDFETLKKSIDFLESYKYDVLDINAGCPSRRAINGQEGGYLMKDFKRLELLIKVAVKNSSKPVSLKVRTGFGRPMVVEDFIKIINNSGLSFITIHARTVKDNYDKDSLDLDTVKEVKSKSSIPVVGNGDITDFQSAKYFINYTKVDALMIGRESMGNPEIFRQIHTYLTSGKEILLKNTIAFLKNNVNVYEKIIEDYLHGISHPYGNSEYKFAELKRNSIWLTKGIENSTNFRIQLSKTKNLEDLRRILSKIYEKS
ncbi:MAG: tRNA dihydrouridine synthase [Promethearchaeota archaeon]|jgi:nifR3 family TIM-barrel protein